MRGAPVRVIGQPTNKSHRSAVEAEPRHQANRAPDRKSCVRCTLSGGERPDRPDRMHMEAFANNGNDGMDRVHDSELKLQRFAQPLPQEAQHLGQRPSDFVSQRNPDAPAR